MATKTLTALGSALGSDTLLLAQQAMPHITTPAILRDSRTEQTLQLLLDRLCFSMTLAKPVGLATWAQREVQNFGVEGVADIANAAGIALLEAADGWAIERTKVQAFVDVLVGEIDRVSRAVEGQHAEPDGGESTSALLSMLAERDSGTCAHSKATAQWARRLAIEMGFAADAQEFIALCALLHDIGKVATPDHVLNKPEALDAAEWDVMREHAAAGARILSQVPSLQRCAVIVRAHHEHYDGTGYPDRLAGSNIPLEARVIAVADAFHAMISERPYRELISPREALWVLEKGAGTQWDRDVVNAMLAMLRKSAHLSHDTSQVSSA